MKRFLCSETPRSDRRVRLSETESHHAVRVLRLRDGEHVLALDGKGKSVEAVLRFGGGGVSLEYVAEALLPVSRQTFPITLEMAILKGDAMEWVIEKAVELGVQALVPLTTDHTVVQVSKKGPGEFQKRWQTMANQALKQCGRLQAMEIALPQEVSRFLEGSVPEPRLWCDEKARGSVGHAGGWLRTADFNALRILIGPEGGWSEAEREALAKAENTHRVDLGPLILRAETAAVFSVSLAAAEFQLREELDKHASSLDSLK